MGACLSAPDTGSKKETGAAGATKGGKVRSRGAGGTRESRAEAAWRRQRRAPGVHIKSPGALRAVALGTALPLPCRSRRPRRPARNPLQAGALAAFDETLILGKVTPDVKELYDSESRKRRSGAPGPRLLLRHPKSSLLLAAQAAWRSCDG